MAPKKKTLTRKATPKKSTNKINKLKEKKVLTKKTASHIINNENELNLLNEDGIKEKK
jgi:hypothetical protein